MSHVGLGGIQESLCLSHVGVEGAGGYTGFIGSVTCGGRGDGGYTGIIGSVTCG